MDARAKAIIEGQARAVGLYTALAPSGLIDAAWCFGATPQFVLQVADVYGVRPGLLGSFRLVRHVLANVATAAVTQQALHMFHVAYGATVAEAGGKFASGVEGAGRRRQRAELGTSPDRRSLDRNRRGHSAFGRGAGEAAEALSGPLVEGLLTAALTVRVGLEAQQECRLFPMTDAEQKNSLPEPWRPLWGSFVTSHRAAPAISRPVTALPPGVEPIGVEFRQDRPARDSPPAAAHAESSPLPGSLAAQESGYPLSCRPVLVENTCFCASLLPRAVVFHSAGGGQTQSEPRGSLHMPGGLALSKLNVLFHPKSIAVVGASTRPARSETNFPQPAVRRVQRLGVPGEPEGQATSREFTPTPRWPTSPARWTWPC